MMKLQYESLVREIYRICDTELELDTREWSEVFRALMVCLYQFHPDVMRAIQNNSKTMSTPDTAPWMVQI